MTYPTDWKADPIVQLENRISPVLTGAYALLTEAVLDRWDDAALTGWKTSAEALCDHLEQGLDALLLPTGFPLGDDGRGACAKAATALRAAIKTMMHLPRSDAEQVELAFVETRTTLEPRLRAALDAARSVFITGVLARQKENAAATGHVMEDLRKLSRTIHMVSINATIEAARSGDAGKGFAVIAEEIRSLANSAETAIGAGRH